MKKTILVVVTFVLCCLIAACDPSGRATEKTSKNSKEAQNMDSNCILKVNGEVIAQPNYVSINHEKQYATLPLITILRASGGKVEWASEKKVTIIFNDTHYVLNPTKKTLKKEGESFNIIAVPPGTMHGGYYQVYDQELIVDSDSLRHFFNLLGAKIKIDYDTSTVNIDFDTHTP